MKNRTPQIAGTERRNPRSRTLDRMSARGVLETISREDARVPAAVAREIPAIAQAVERTVEALRRGGRLIYVGAGTSGRLAALDAAECPPTFGTSPRRVQAVIAGGRRALSRAVEGAEDSLAQGARDLRARRVSAKDVVVGLSASGSTPYVLGALRWAKGRGAASIGITSNRRSPLARLAELTITPEVGAEVIAGSTRMKAGTAQKLVLNMLSTASMVRLGAVYDNWMVNVLPGNRKLRQRALLILEEATGARTSEAKRALSRARRAARHSGHALRVALVMLKTGLGAGPAMRRLEAVGGNLRRALRETFSGPHKARSSRPRTAWKSS